MDYFSKLGYVRATVCPFVLVRLFESVGSFIGSFKRLCPFGPVELFSASWLTCGVRLFHGLLACFLIRVGSLICTEFGLVCLHEPVCSFV